MNPQEPWGLTGGPLGDPEHVVLGHVIGDWLLINKIIRRPRPLPRQGRRLGPPEVWNLALSVKPSKPSKRLFGSPNPAINSFFLAFKPAVCQPSKAPNPKCFFGSPNPAGQGTKAPSIAFSWRSSLPFASPQTLQMPFWQPINNFFLAFKPAVCQPSNPPNAPQAKAPRPHQ